jgi:serine/threonine protein kinase
MRKQADKDGTVMVELEERTLDHYLLKQRLARGGMSEIYLAYDQQQERDVAIKVVNKENDDYARRFRREIHALSALEHEHILPMLDYGEQGQWLYLVMPYIEHGTLRALLRAKGHLSREETGAILAQLCEALQFAHDHGIIHRDIKPSNILLSEGKHVYLADFGLVKEVDKFSDLTQTGCIVGTPEYMAPELAEELASKSSDIYSVGILLYQMLTGQVPFKGPSALAVYWKHMQEQPVRPSLINPDLSPAVEQVVLCALEKVPQLRFKSVQALVRAYEQALLAPVEHPQLKVTAPLAPIIAIVPIDGAPRKTPALLDMRRVVSSKTSHRVEIAVKHSPHRTQLSRKVMAGMVGVMLLMALPLFVGYSLYNTVSHTYTALGANVQFTPVTSTQTSNRTDLTRLKPPKGTSTPPPRVVTSSYHSVIIQPTTSPDKHKHKHKHKHGND